MEFKKSNMINYMGTMHPILRQGFFNNHIGKYLNRNLFFTLGPLEQNNPRIYHPTQQCIQAANTLKHNFNASNLGEFLVSFTQRYNSSSIVDLRTILYFAINAINYDTSENYILPSVPGSERPKVSQEISDEQLKIFYNGVKETLTKQFDFFTAATLLQAPKLISVSGTECLNEIIFTVFEEICKQELPFEENVYGIFSIISCIDSYEKAGLQPPYTKDSFEDGFIEALDAVDFNPSSNIEDTPVYLMLAYLFETYKPFSSSKKFKNKVKYKMFKQIHSLTIKPYKLPEIEEACSLIGFSKEIAIYLNYLAFQNLSTMKDKVMLGKLSVSSKKNIQNNLVTLLENEAPIPAFIVQDIDMAVMRQTKSKEQNLYAIISNFFTNIYTGNLSRANLYFVTQRYKLNQFNEFMTNERWSHLFNSNQSQSTNINQNTVQASTSVNISQSNKQTVETNVPAQSTTIPTVKPNTQAQGIPSNAQLTQQTTQINVQNNSVPTAANVSAQKPQLTVQANAIPTVQPNTQAQPKLQPIRPNNPVVPTVSSNNTAQTTTSNTNAQSQGLANNTNTQPIPAATQNTTQQTELVKNFVEITLPTGPVSLF